MRVSGLSAVVLAAVVSAQAASAQTGITPPKNKYTPAQDVQLGSEAAAQVEQQLPMMHDDNVTSYVAGHRPAAGRLRSRRSCSTPSSTTRSRS